MKSWYFISIYIIICFLIWSSHAYADDTQLYLSFSPNVSIDEEAAVCAVENYIREVSGSEPVRCETTEGSSIQFIGYLMPQHEQNDCTMLFTRHEATKLCREISIFKMFSRGVHLHNRSPIVLATPTLNADI